MDSTPIYQYAKPTSARLEPPKSLDPIITPGYEQCPCFIKLIREQSFSGEGDENSYSHLREFEQTCACLHIASMSDETLRWKLFPFSLMGKAKQWYSQTVGSMQGDWKTLCSKFCLCFFPISRVVSLWKKVLNFRQLEEESLGTSPLAQTLLFQTWCSFNIFIWVLVRILRKPLIKPLEELFFICLLVKQGQCLIRLVEKLPTLAIIINSSRKRRNHLLNKKRKFW